MSNDVYLPGSISGHVADFSDLILESIYLQIQLATDALHHTTMLTREEAAQIIKSRVFAATNEIIVKDAM